MRWWMMMTMMMVACDPGMAPTQPLDPVQSELWMAAVNDELPPDPASGCGWHEQRWSARSGSTCTFVYEDVTALPFDVLASVLRTTVERNQGCRPLFVQAALQSPVGDVTGTPWLATTGLSDHYETIPAWLHGVDLRLAVTLSWGPLGTCNPEERAHIQWVQMDVQRGARR